MTELHVLGSHYELVSGKVSQSFTIMPLEGLGVLPTMDGQALLVRYKDGRARAVTIEEVRDLICLND